MSHYSHASESTQKSEISLKLAGTGRGSMAEVLDYFDQVDNFLVIKEPKFLCKSDVRMTETGPSGGKGQPSKKISTKQWPAINKFHLIEPNPSG